MKVGDYFVQGRRGWVRLHEKGGKEHEVPCHHKIGKLARRLHRRRRSSPAAAAGIETKIGHHTFRPTGITAYLKNGGTLEIA